MKAKMNVFDQAIYTRFLVYSRQQSFGIGTDLKGISDLCGIMVVKMRYMPRERYVFSYCQH